MICLPTEMMIAVIVVCISIGSNAVILVDILMSMRRSDERHTTVTRGN